MSKRTALVLAVLAFVSCRKTTLVGSLICLAPSDCAPPSTICGVDGRCVPGCTSQPQACVGGASCDPATGQCSGAPTCSDDTMCDPPATVCNPSTRTCVAGCTLAGCTDGLRCKFDDGHCCDPSSPDCPLVPDAGPTCNGDSECVGAPANICSGGACVPGCATTGCSAPLSCDTATGHCETMSCARDLDCDPGSYCTQAQTCSVLAFAGPITCSTGGGTSVSYSCEMSTTAADFRACAGAPGPTGCPYCVDGSCYHPGLCSSDADCHRGDHCLNGLCLVQSPECPTTVPIGQVVQGVYAAGKEICVRDVVTSVRSGNDGNLEIKLGSSPYLFVDISEMYETAKVRVPNVGETVTVHGTVRWDEGHYDRELLPVDWVSAN